jgi:predicted O-methyltransferase YrrM
MFYKLLKAYKELGYKIHIGNNKRFPVSIGSDRELSTGLGASITDVAFFFGLANIFKPERILCIGNAFGYSTLCIAEIFKGIPIDAIDAECEGSDNQKGSELTRQISQKYYNNQVNLQIGYSPQDLKLFSGQMYDFIFIDAYHDNDHLLADFNGVLPYAKPSCVMYLHDVGLTNMLVAWEQIKDSNGFKGYNIDFTNFGCKGMVRNLSEVQSWFEFLNASPFPLYQNPPAVFDNLR